MCWCGRLVGGLDKRDGARDCRALAAVRDCGRVVGLVAGCYTEVALTFYVSLRRALGLAM